MSVLESPDLDKRHAEQSLEFLANDKSVQKFNQILRADQVTVGTRKTYLFQLSRIRKLLPDDLTCDLGELPEDEVTKVLAKIADISKGTGFLITARTMKRFYRSLGRPELAAKIRVPSKKSRLPDILSEKELKALLDAAGAHDGSLRNRLVIELLWETGCRVGELCHLKIKDVQFDQHSAIIYLDGKTGQRRLRAFTCRPDLLEYINNHPFKNNPNEYFFLSSEGHGGNFHQLTGSGVRQLVATLSQRVLKRRIHPHTLRHTRATELSKYMTDRELKIFGGWKRTSMLEVYSHLSGRDVDEKLLALHGIKVKDSTQDSSVSVRICRNGDCGAENSPMSVYCQKCGEPLVADATEAILRDPKFIESLTRNREFIEALKSALKGA
jgi:site-specific recombinase XerD/ribosomal protein L40E